MVTFRCAPSFQLSLEQRTSNLHARSLSQQVSLPVLSCGDSWSTLLVGTLASLPRLVLIFPRSDLTNLQDVSGHSTSPVSSALRSVLALEAATRIAPSLLLLPSMDSALEVTFPLTRPSASSSSRRTSVSCSRSSQSSSPLELQSAALSLTALSRSTLATLTSLSPMQMDWFSSHATSLEVSGLAVARRTTWVGAT